MPPAPSDIGGKELSISVSFLFSLSVEGVVEQSAQRTAAPDELNVSSRAFIRAISAR
jgi:hypothetical protein